MKRYKVSEVDQYLHAEDEVYLAADVEALESFCEGLKGVNDDLRARIAELGGERENNWKWGVKKEQARFQQQQRAERAEKERDVEMKKAVALFDAYERSEKRLAEMVKALEIAIDGEHPEGLKKHKCVTITCEGQPREPTRPEEFEFCEGVMSMAYEVHCILTAPTHAHEEEKV